MTVTSQDHKQSDNDIVRKEISVEMIFSPSDNNKLGRGGVGGGCLFYNCTEMLIIRNTNFDIQVRCWNISDLRNKTF